VDGWQRFGQITIVPTDLNITDRQLLLHEMLHFNYLHDLALRDALGDDNLYAEIDRAEACASLCIAPLVTTACSCARCLQKSTCGPECSGFTSAPRGGCEKLCNDLGDCSAFHCGQCKTCRAGNGCQQCDPCKEKCDGSGTCQQVKGAPPGTPCGDACCSPGQQCVNGKCQSPCQYKCPCPNPPNGGKIYNTCTECLVACPEGLGCFGYSTCVPIGNGCGTCP